MNESLSGIKVLDFTQAMSGPFATMLLGDLGADIIKVEPPDGDQTRSWAPPYMNGVSSYFISTNRNKRSISIDLKTSKGKEIVKKLIARTDILIENFRPGTMDRLGFSYEEVRLLNPEIIYCSISGYGQNGPMKNFPGYDLTILAMSGLLGITGKQGSDPVKFGVPIGDITTALFASVSMLAALYCKKNNGKGQYIDISMLDSNFFVLTHQLMSYLSTGKDPERLGSAHASIAPYQAYKTSDGYIVITVGTEKLWKKFCDVLDPKLAERVEFIDNSKRVLHRELLEKEINKLLMNRTTDDIYRLLANNGIPCAPVNSINEAVNNKQLNFRKMIYSMNSEHGKITIPGTPFKMSETPGSIRIPPPVLGNANKEILEEAGFNDNEIRELYNNKVIFSRQRDDLNE